MDINGFYTGDIMDAYTWLGAHLSPEGVTFRVYAPHAEGVCVLINDNEIPMERICNGQFYECHVWWAKPGMAYEYRIYHHGRFTDHCDPYGFGMDMRPAHRSIIRDLYSYTFNDGEWMEHRTDCRYQPLNIYELHAGSWMKKHGYLWHRYDELAYLLIPYLKENGYTHVEFMPLGEHPADESWGYQATGFFAPTSRYGTIDQLKKLIDLLHQNDIGAILDIVPAHFALDDYGLHNFDGSAIYEKADGKEALTEWGSYSFWQSRGEVRTFLQSCADYWLKEYHFDGLRMDAIRNLIFKQGNDGETNPDGIEFLKKMNMRLKEENPDCMLIAEDSSAFPGVTRSVYDGGLGFDYKWDLGWMNDTLNFFKTPPDERPYHYHKLTFSMVYFPNERYLLPLSHDEVVHGKATILHKMYGDLEGKFPQARALYLFMMVHPGKKLNFMGNEFGQIREWDEKKEQDWYLLSDPTHDAFFKYMKRLNHMYLEHPALYVQDYDGYGFSWLDCNLEEQCVYAFLRNGGYERLAAVFNLSDQPQHYEAAVPGAGFAGLMLYTDWEEFGGQTKADEQVSDFHDGKLFCELAPYSGMLFGMA